MVGGGGMWTAGDLWCAVLWFVLFEEVNVNSRLHQTAQTIKSTKWTAGVLWFVLFDEGIVNSCLLQPAAQHFDEA